MRSLGRMRARSIDGSHVTETADTITIHNHIPYGRARDYQAPGEPEWRDPRGSDGGEEEPPWFTEHKAATDAKFRALNQALGEIASGLREFFSQEEEEPEEEHAADELSVGGMRQLASGLVPPSAVARSTRSATGAPPKGPAPGTRKGNNPMWKNTAHGALTETSEEEDGPLVEHHFTGDSGLFSPAAINRRALQLRRSRPTW
jgi:hypothetical protein